MNALEYALDYAARGWLIFPTPPGEKKSYKSGRNANGVRWGATRDKRDIMRDFQKWENAGVGIMTGPESGIFVVEIDTVDGHAVDGAASLAALEKQHGKLPLTLMGCSPSGSIHRYFTYPKTTIIRNSDGKIGPGIDVRGDGGMVLAPPTLRPGKGNYKWLNKTPVVEAPPWLIKLCVADTSANGHTNMVGLFPPADPRDLARAIAVIPNEDVSWEEFNRVGMAIFAAYQGDDAGEEEFHNWAKKSKKYDKADTIKKWRALKGCPPTQLSAGTLFFMADKAAPSWRNARKAGCPVIKVKANNLSLVADQCEIALLEGGEDIYQRGDALVRPVISDVDAAHGRKTKIARLVEIEQVYMRDLLGRIADFQLYKKGSKTGAWVQINPPMEVAATVLARVGEWKAPTLIGVVTTPTMRPDGSLLLTPGYDAVTRLLLVEPPPMPPIPETPTRADALAALAKLKALLAEFPLVAPADTAVALSAMITPVVRGAFTVAPMHATRAPVAGSGKSFLFDVVAAIAIGQIMPVISKGPHEEELEKRLGAAMMAGQPLISIDNVNGELAGDALCQIIERPVVDIRILGKSERVRIEARGTTMYCTGNNITLVGDLCRRVIMASLDPRLERPELRVFKGDPISTILADRGAYVAACLTICLAYHKAGRPKKAKRLASFEGWSDVVRSALIWLGEADAVDTMELAREEDPELVQVKDFMAAWGEVLGVGVGHKMTLKDVATIAEETKMSPTGEYRPSWPSLTSALRAITNWRAGELDLRKLGLWLRDHHGRVVGGLRIAKNTTSKTTYWYIDGPTAAGKWK